MEHISNHQAQTKVQKGAAVIIDVRETGEFREQHIHGAINIPSTAYKPEHYGAFSDLKICLVCQSGQRSKKIHDLLKKDGFTNLAILETQMENYHDPAKVKGWSIDRQFRITLGILLAIALTLYALGYEYGLIIPVILCVGLIFTSIIDRCYMRMAIARMPWNRNRSA
ncbi:MAG: hypothetical protein COA80_12275 [Leeuwenhoekiella sp.]|nr:MAG: hypothetical protein COA80_12275 [Leeuwenhoekiella sp.]